MKKVTFIFSLFILICSCNSNNKRELKGETEYQQKENARFKDGSKSPLKKKDLRNFKGLDFFPVDSNFIVTANLKRIENAPIFEMATNTERKPLYKEFGILTFNINDKKHELTIYQSQDDLKDESLKNNLFLPFTDGTSGNESYGGGRYMDVLTTDISNKNTLKLNFNNTYNPYCAYNENFSCPLTPRKNHLDIEIKAGIKAFEKH